MPLPSNADRVVFYGWWWDEATGGGTRKPDNTAATVTLAPVPLGAFAAATNTPNVRDLSVGGRIKTRTRTATVDAGTGYYAVVALASNDPDLEAYGGRQVTFYGEAPFVVEVPYNAPLTTVSAAMADATGLVEGSQVRALRLEDAALVTTPVPTPPINYLTSEQTLAAAEGVVDAHDTDPDAHADIRAAIDDVTGAVSSVAGRTGDVTLSKADVGLNNVNNTADANKPVSIAQQTAIDAVAAAVPEVARDTLGAALVAGSNVTITPNDAGDTITISVTVPSSYSDEQAQDAFAALVAAGTHSGISFAYNDAGNGLSATVAAQTYNQVGATRLTVGGAYQATYDLDTTPVTAADVGAQPADSDLTALAALAPADDALVQRKGGAWTARTPAQVKTDLALGKGDVGLGNVSNTAPADLPVSSATQTALDGKASLVGGKVPQSQLPAVALTEFLGAVASQTAMLALDGQRGDWATRTDRGTDWQLVAEPSTSLSSWREMSYPASPVNSVNGRTGSVTGLAESSDLTAHTGRTDNPHATTKAQVGLGNVDNTADTAKPVSTAQQTALDGRQPLDTDLTTIAAIDATQTGVLASEGAGWLRRTYAQIKTSLALVKADVGLGSVDNTSDAGKPVSTAQQSALDAKQPLDSDLTTIAGLTATTDSVMQAKAGAWSARTLAQLAADLIGNTGTSLAAGNDARFTQATTNSQSGTAYTLVLSDAGAVVEMTSASASTVTVPPSSSVTFPIGTLLEVSQYGAGQVTIAAGAGVVVRTAASMTTRAQYSSVALRKRGTDEWIISGDLT